MLPLFLKLKRLSGGHTPILLSVEPPPIIPTWRQTMTLINKCCNLTNKDVVNKQICNFHKLMLSLASWKLNRRIWLLLIAKLHMHSTWQVYLNNVEDDHWHVAPPVPVATSVMSLKPYSSNTSRAEFPDTTYIYSEVSSFAFNEQNSMPHEMFWPGAAWSHLGDWCKTCSACLGSPTNFVYFQMYRRKGVSVLVPPMLQNRSYVGPIFYVILVSKYRACLVEIHHRKKWI